MMQMILGRLLFTIVLTATFAVAASAFIAGNRMWVRSHLKKNQYRGKVNSAAPTLLYFCSASCAQCKPQENQIEQARTRLERIGSKLEVKKFDALVERELAKSLHVMTVPTTVLMDTEGNIVAWNPGLTRSQKIVNQYESIAR